MGYLSIPEALNAFHVFARLYLLASFGYVQNFEQTQWDNMLKMYGGCPLLVRRYAVRPVLVPTASCRYLVCIRLEL